MPEKVTDELVFEQLKRIQDSQTRLIEDVGDLKSRMTFLDFLRKPARSWRNRLPLNPAALTGSKTALTASGAASIWRARQLNETRASRRRCCRSGRAGGGPERGGGGFSAPGVATRLNRAARRSGIGGGQVQNVPTRMSDFHHPRT